MSIVQDPEHSDGAPTIDGTGIRVEDVALAYEHSGYEPDEITQLYPDLSLAEVHRALAYDDAGERRTRRRRRPFHPERPRVRRAVRAMARDREPVSEDAIEALREGMEAQRSDIREALAEDLGGESEDDDVVRYFHDRAEDARGETDR